VEFFRSKSWDIVGKTKLWFTLSGVVLAIGMIALLTMHLNYGIDFSGGSLHRYSFAMPLASGDAEVPSVLAKIRPMLSQMGLEGTQIQVVGDASGALTSLYIRAPRVANDAEAATRDREIVAGLGKLFADKGAITDLGRETVGPVVGNELKANAALALLVGWLLILVYITIRYEFRFAVAGIVALVHDTLFVLGLMAVLRIELDSAFVAAILTVLGYSINDSVVIFDRIRENMRLRRRADFAETVNRSLLDTLARSVNTTLTTLFPLIALFLFGGKSIEAFALTLIAGISVGSYSSIFVAAPIVALWERRTSQQRAEALSASRSGRARATAAAGDAGAVETPAAKASQAAVIERLQKEEQDERQQMADGEAEAKRQERRDRRKREKEREAKKSKRRF